jgi:hypothetical protein
VSGTFSGSGYYVSGPQRSQARVRRTASGVFLEDAEQGLGRSSRMSSVLLPVLERALADPGPAGAVAFDCPGVDEEPLDLAVAFTVHQQPGALFGHRCPPDLRPPQKQVAIHMP